MTPQRINKHPSNRAHLDLIAFLSALAARARYVIQPMTDALTVEIGGSENNQRPVFSIGTFDEARKRGWINGDTSTNSLRITRAGREVLRRYQACRVAGKAGAPPAECAPTVNPKESPLTWLASRRDSSGKPMLNRWEVDAGERLRADLSFAQLTPRVTMGWSGIPISGKRSATAASGHEIADNVVAARMRVTDALRAVGPEFADILIDVCGHLRGLEDISRCEGWPRRAARLILQRALSALARHYKIGPEIRIEETIARRLRHWGSDDYRPSLDRWRPKDG